MMLVLLAAAQINRLVVAILDMQPDGVFVKFAAGIQIDHVEHDVTASDDVEWRIENMLRHGHRVEILLEFAVIAGQRVARNARPMTGSAKQSIFLAARNGLLRRKRSSQ
jgi:hypothetical protein